MNLRFRKLRKYSLGASIAVASMLYQNCGQMATFEADSGYAALGSSLGTDHPSVVELAKPAQKMLVINRNATATLVRDVFTSTSTPVPDLEGIIQKWIGNRSPQYGGSCNIYDSNAGRDCGDQSNTNMAAQQDDNTLRESFHAQFCENILAYDQAVSAVKEKITTSAVTPDASSIGQIYQLFYRAEDPNPLVTNTLIDMDRALAQKSVAPLERWRAVILQICVSPGWELL